ncbi:hypothetical protein CLPU_5c00180 [Gottschalkia purinilytica]|uniref:YIEGIA protein n=1 Tax=Gottschalkia purinilytica TaxID=1503 RepID=A0A0L0WB44_GOTPU|nr:hypothetical protein CLPU_5c00180 [Gottschalkia purinilytica]
MGDKLFKYGFIIVPAILVGFISRLAMLKIDYRQYPSYPQGVFTHLTLGIIASALGAVAVPALADNEFSAVTFLSLAAQQFREVRNLERQSLDNIEPTELVARGTAYIEDIAKAFEARNYVTMIVSLIVSIVIYLMTRMNIGLVYSISIGLIVGIVSLIYLNKAISRETLEDIAEVKIAKISFEGPLLRINDTVIMNIGSEKSRQIYKENGIAVEIIPHDKNGIETLANTGQRQAIQHNAAALLGIRKDVDEPDFTPIARRDPHTGRVVMSIVAMDPDEDCLVEAVKQTIVLESSRRKPLNSKIGRRSQR